MKIISFAWTTHALLAGRKTCTRRSWGVKYAEGFHKGDLVQAWSRSPRFHGKAIAIICLSCDPYQELTGRMVEKDYDAEGLKWMEENNKLIQGKRPCQFWKEWKEAGELVWVVRFELMEVINGQR